MALWHVAFNVYWLWVLGGVVERTLGRLPYAGLLLAAAIISSSVQLGISGSTGHGASGVVYALFGLIWTSRKNVPAYSEALKDNTAPLFWTWLVGCVLATQAGIVEIGNAAHVSGLAFGLLTARWLIPTPHRTLAMAGTGLLCVAAIVPLFWSPWSPMWVGYRAYKAHAAGDYDTAIERYRRSIALGGDRLWALRNLAMAHHAKGAMKEYDATIAEIRALDSAAGAKLEAEVSQPPDTERQAEE